MNYILEHVLMPMAVSGFMSFVTSIFWYRAGYARARLHVAKEVSEGLAAGCGSHEIMWTLLGGIVRRRNSMKANWNKGQRLQVTYEGITVNGTVKLASPNSVSLILEFEAVLGCYPGEMPVMYDDAAAGYVDLVHHREVKLSRPLTEN